MAFTTPGTAHAQQSLLQKVPPLLAFLPRPWVSDVSSHRGHGIGAERRLHEQACLSPKGASSFSLWIRTSENLVPGLGPQIARAPGPFSSEVQTKVEWKGLQEQEHAEGRPQAKTLFCSGEGGLMGETCHVITSRILTDSSGIREKLHPQLQL